MKTFHLAVLSLTVLAAGCASYSETVMDPWLNASESELTSVWGYPSSSTDIVQIDSQTKVYTYRYDTSDAMTGAPTKCRISFTLRSDYVQRWDLNGAGCPRNKRSP